MPSSGKESARRPQDVYANTKFGGKGTDLSITVDEAISINEDQLRVSPDNIRIANNSKPSFKKEGWYDWEVYLDVDPEVARKIKSVTYTLHPTFQERVITINHDPNGKYALDENGWGEFQIRADIRLNNDDTITKYHWLDLGTRSGKWQGGRG